jgi:4-aminobutyrate aminotransferase-like enzyme
MVPSLKTPVPGPRSRALAHALKRHEAPTVTYVSKTWPIFWRRARGVNVWDADGNRFLDLTSAFGVASLGHAHPRVMAAVRQQSRRLAHSMGDVHPAESKVLLCERLSKITFERWSAGRIRGQTLLGNSGFEAVEMALKTARLATRRRGVIAFKGAYHGLGYGALETTWRADFRRPFADQLGQFASFVPYPRASVNRADEERQLDRVEKACRSILRRGETGAILVEPCQGRGGEVVPPSGFLTRLRRLCDEHRALLIADEIYTGFWRTGTWFTVEGDGVIPDMICLGKALTGCLPLSACVGRTEVMKAWPESDGEALHTSTFLGNPLACTAAVASIAEFEKHAAEWQVPEKGCRWKADLQRALKSNRSVGEVRGLGLMLGIEFRPGARLRASAVCEALLRRGILALPSGARSEILALTPPLIISEQELQWSTRIIADCMR